jgi:uncharacterized PurR-regulated membrane protein YhhQ (DUF165 family)
MQGGVRVVRTIEFPLSSDTEGVSAGRAAARTFLPVLALSSLLIVMHHLLGQPLAVFADSQGAWFSWSHLLLALAFVAIQLTNRRYGPDYAFAQIVLSLGICGVILIVLPAQSLPAASLPTTREGMAFVVAFLASGFLSIIAFEGTRGAQWWRPPLIGYIVAGASFVLLFYPAAYAGSDSSWSDHMRVHAGVLVLAAVAGLLPYWLLRSSVKPLPGFGGY